MIVLLSYQELILFLLSHFKRDFSPLSLRGIVCIKDARLSRFLANPPKLCPEEGIFPDEIDGIQSAPAVASMWGIHQLYAFNNFGYGQCASKSMGS